METVQKTKIARPRAASMIEQSVEKFDCKLEYDHTYSKKKERKEKLLTGWTSQPCQHELSDYDPGQKLLGRLCASLHFTLNSIILTIGWTIWERACSCGPPPPYSMLEEKSPFCFVQNPRLRGLSQKWRYLLNTFVQDCSTRMQCADRCLSQAFNFVCHDLSLNFTKLQTLLKFIIWSNFRAVLFSVFYRHLFDLVGSPLVKAWFEKHQT